MIGASYLRLNKSIDPRRPLRHAVEIRHASFQSPDFLKILRTYEVAVVVADTAGKWPFLEDITSDFVYARLHGDSELYVSGYSSRALDRWASRVRAWQKKNLDVYIYFDNDVKVHAPFDAIQLSQHVNGYTPLHAMARHPKELFAKPRTSWPEY